ncbi:MAG: hypothetical protein K9H64_12510 [Bacteroidales bacterium]|nr:hypothetical protein [Bacteroidales bacterium]MCF8456867.1 hypothetical protein [Bacteroidales bacterium]
MPKNFTKLFIAILLLTIGIFGVGAYLSTSLFEAYYLPVFPWLLLFFFLVNVGAHYFRAKSAEGKPTSFPRHLMAINGAKIFLYLIFMIIYIFLYREDARNFLIGFIILYFIFFVFELAASRK